MTQLTTPSPSLATLFDLPNDDDLLEPRADLWGFGGLHGGLALALLVEHAHRHAGEAPLRSVTAAFDRAVREPFTVESALRSAGRTVVTATASVQAAGHTAVTATATFAHGDAQPHLAPPPVPAPPPEACDVFTVPREFVPFAVHTEIRPVGPQRPFAAGDRAELTAWIRLVGDDAPPDTLRLLVLVDALAPSYAAVLARPTPIPTVELTARPADAASGSPWVLLHAATTSVTGAWVHEHLDAWAEDGTHLGTATQLRLIR